MKPNQILLIRQLLEYDSVRKADDLARSLQVSTRSIKNYIHDINLAYPQAIQATRCGYRINREIMYPIMQKIQNHKNSVPQTSRERVSYIISTIFRSDHPVDVYELCEDMYISLSTLKIELQKTKRKAARFDLELVFGNDHITIEGEEKQKRKLLSSLLYQENQVNFINLDSIQNAFLDIDIPFIKKTILDVLRSHHYFINDYSLMNLILHITIAIHRIQNHNLSHTDAAYREAVHLPEYALAEELAEQLGQYFQIVYTEPEIHELTLLLISRASSIDYQALNASNLELYIEKEYLDLVEELITLVNTNYYLDLHDSEFFIRFSLHIKNLLIRSKSNYLSKNPLTENVRSTCPLIYDISVFIADSIRQKTSVRINDDEIAYIAFHLGSALEIQKDRDTKLTAAIFCPTYYDTDQKLLSGIKQHFDEDLLIADVVTEEGNLLYLPKVDMIITTLPLMNRKEIPVIQVSLFVNRCDQQHIADLIQQLKLDRKQHALEERLRMLLKPELFMIGDTFQNREQVLDHMAQCLQKHGYVDEAYRQELDEREAMSSTAYTDFAIPHTIKMHAFQTAVSVYISQNPIHWKDRKIHLVIMLCFNSRERYLFNEIFEPIAMILNVPQNIGRLVTCTTYDEFLSTMVSLYR